MISLVCLDSDAAGDHQDSKLVVPQVLAELGRDPVEEEVAYREGVRHVRRLQKSPQELQESAKLSHTSFLNGRPSTALITGGLGGLGIVTAEALVEAGVQCVVLASRSGRVKYSDQGLEQRLDNLRATGIQVLLPTSQL